MPRNGMAETWAGHLVTPCWTFWGLGNSFLKNCSIFIISSSNMSCSFSTPFQRSCVLIAAILVNRTWCSTKASATHCFLNDKWWWTSFDHYWSWIFQKKSKPSAHSKLGYLFFYWWIINSLYILDSRLHHVSDMICTWFVSETKLSHRWTTIYLIYSLVVCEVDEASVNHWLRWRFSSFLTKVLYFNPHVKFLDSFDLIFILLVFIHMNIWLCQHQLLKGHYFISLDFLGILAENWLSINAVG